MISVVYFILNILIVEKTFTAEAETSSSPPASILSSSITHCQTFSIKDWIVSILSFESHKRYPFYISILFIL